MKRMLFSISITLLLSACSTTRKAIAPSKGEQLIQQAITAHGGKKYDQARYSFVFRNAQFSVQFTEGAYQYTRSTEKDGSKIVEEMTNTSYTRTIDGVQQEIKEEDLPRYRNSSINSVIYFAMLPYKLDDPAVRKTYVGETTIKLKPYDIVEVTFAEEGGGKDHEDTFMYWIGKDDHIIDYLAYNYKVNKGGVRFRAAYKPRIIDGIRFQNYINYKAPLETPLLDLSRMYEAGELEELSKIELENIKSIIQ